MLLVVLLLFCCSIVPIFTETSTNQKELLERASAQLQRLTPYRKTTDQVESDSASFERSIERQKETSEDSSREREEQKIAMEILQMLEKSEEFQKAMGVTKRIDDNKLTLDFVADPRYTKFLQDQERIKRSGSGGIITGSGSIISGIASGLIGGITSASGAASRGSSGSSQPTHVVYGPHVHPYGEKTFDVWDFKKAILNTVIQALKAISGGVLALKGQLIKGSGFLISTKGRIVSTTGEAISSLGRHIAASAVVQPPKPAYGHPSYSYDHPPIEHDTYDGPPPHVEDYSGPANTYNGHSSYPSASDDEDRAELLVVKSTKTEQNDNNNNDNNNNNDHFPDLDPRHPNLQDLENSFGGPQKGSNEQNLAISEGSSNDNKDTSQKNNLISSVPYIQQSQQTYNPNEGVYNKDLDYQLEKDKFPPIYQSIDAQKVEPSLASNLGAQLSIQQSLEYPTIHLQQIRYSLPEKNLATLSYNDELSSLHSSLPVSSPQFDTLKISMLEHQNGLEVPKLQLPDFKALPTFSGFRIGIATQEPLTLPVPSPVSAAHYWSSRGAPSPTVGVGVGFPSKNLIWRRSSLQRKKLAARSPASLRDRKPFRA